MALRSAHIPASRIAIATIGSASVAEDGRGAATVAKELRPILSQSRLLVEADARIAVEGALGGAPGVVIVSGTGSIVLGKNRQGRVFRVGGWGYLIGDEGSAQWVGREAVRRAAHAADRTGRKTVLLAAVRRHFRLRSMDRLIDVIYAKPQTPADWGNLSPLVSQAAQAGDRVAREILEDGASHLGAQAASAANQLRTRSALVSFQGSMFRIGPLFLNPLRAALKEQAPQAKLVPPMLSPLGGAFLMTLRSVSISVTPAKLSRLREIFSA
jgi:N-acetylglucosamine kinase-like BadF-type ATPase